MIEQPAIYLAQSAAGGQPLRRSRIDLGSHRSALLGVRRFSFPFMAAGVATNMGPVRHALSQMVVAGVMTTQPPVRILVEKQS